MARRSELTIFGRFWQKVQFGRPDECWIWTGARDSKGYGSLGLGGGDSRSTSAHRIAFELGGGVASDQVRHTCDEPACVNPAHLLAGTHAENMADMVARGRVARGERCPQARLTDALVREIRASVPTSRCAHCGRSGIRGHRGALGALARRHAVSYRSVYSAATSRTWRHVSALESK